LGCDISPDYLNSAPIVHVISLRLRDEKSGATVSRVAALRVD
jgi:hypothetical protein